MHQLPRPTQFKSIHCHLLVDVPVIIGHACMLYHLSSIILMEGISHNIIICYRLPYLTASGVVEGFHDFIITPPSLPVMTAWLGVLKVNFYISIWRYLDTATPNGNDGLVTWL